VFAGQVVHAPPQHPDIITTGPVTDDDKWAAMAGASALVHPSANESFGIVLLESWAVGRPVLVNAHCPATVEHVRRSGGGLTFGGYAAFETALDRLMGDADVAAAMGEAGREYGRDTFAWPVVTTRYRRWLERLVH
jgi:glycosyltransferase involved in cell wall biosynthesis